MDRAPPAEPAARHAGLPGADLLLDPDPRDNRCARASHGARPVVLRGQEVGWQSLMPKTAGPQVERFSFAQRIEHFLLLILFNLLALTGLPQKYSTTDWAERLVRLMGGIETTRLIHRTAAVCLIAMGIWHLVDIIVTRRRPVRRHDMKIGLKDILDLIGDIKFLAGMTRERPRFGRFDYRQKFEYWAVLWGTVL